MNHQPQSPTPSSTSSDYSPHAQTLLPMSGSPVANPCPLLSNARVRPIYPRQAPSPSSPSWYMAAKLDVLSKCSFFLASHIDKAGNKTAKMPMQNGKIIQYQFTATKASTSYTFIGTVSPLVLSYDWMTDVSISAKRLNKSGKSSRALQVVLNRLIPGSLPSRFLYWKNLRAEFSTSSVFWIVLPYEGKAGSASMLIFWVGLDSSFLY